MIGDLSSTADSTISRPDSATMSSSIGLSDTKPSLSAKDIEGREFEIELTASNNEEDNHLKDTTGSFADWVTNFILRVIQLLENLPEESAAGGASEGDI
jgi:proteasome activator subunit 4